MDASASYAKSLLVLPSEIQNWISDVVAERKATIIHVGSPQKYDDSWIVTVLAQSGVIFHIMRVMWAVSPTAITDKQVVSISVSDIEMIVDNAINADDIFYEVKHSLTLLDLSDADDNL